MVKEAAHINALRGKEATVLWPKHYLAREKSIGRTYKCRFAQKPQNTRKTAPMDYLFAPPEQNPVILEWINWYCALHHGIERHRVTGEMADYNYVRLFLDGKSLGIWRVS